MEPTQSAGCEVLRFGIFEIDPASGELRRNGSLVRLPPQPFQVLQLLVQNAGDVVDRERIRREVWGETAVDFDRSLNVCIAQIRAALNDSAENARFIQTLPRRGYRFLVTVDRPMEPAPPAKSYLYAWAAAALLAICIAAAAFRFWPQPQQAVRIAVLPFETVGIAAGDNAQIEGLFDELLTRLGGLQPDRMRVIGRRSVSRFREEHPSVKEIGQRLDVRYVVEATVRADDRNLRVAMRLVQADNEAVLWSETFSQDTDPATFEEQFLARASAALLTSLFPGAPINAAVEAGCRQDWEPYRTGRMLANHGTIASLEKSLPFFEQTHCAAGRAALADALVRLARAQSRRQELWDRVRVAAHEALRMEPELVSPHNSLGNAAFWRDWDWKTAEQEFQTALRRNPSDPDAHHDYAWLLMALGRRQEALASLQRSIALDPLSARISMDAAWLLLQAGRFQDAAVQARRALELDPEMTEARACLSRALLYAGDDRGAMEAIRQNATSEELASVANLSPREAIRTLFRASKVTDPYQRAWRLAFVGTREETLTQIEAAFQARSSMMPFIAVDPAFAALHNEPRFQKVVRDMRL